MRILRIDGWDGPTFGGAQVYVSRISRALAARGHPNEVTAVVTDPVPAALEPVRAFRLPRTLMGQALAEAPASKELTRWLDRAASEFRPDLIHLHRFRAGFTALGPWLGSRPEPLVFTAHDADLVCPVSTLTLPSGERCPGGILPRCQLTGCAVGLGLPGHLAKRYYFDRFVRPRVHAFLCVSNATKSIFEGLGYRPTELLRPMFPFPESLGQGPDGPFTIGFLGRFEHQKGVGVLLEAFARVRATHPDVRLRLTGAGPYAVPPTPGVTVTGWTGDVDRWFDGVHVVVVPSLPWENLGNTSVEALGHGVPVIVSDSGGLPETVGEFGTVTPAGDSVALADAIGNVLSNYDDARRTASAGRGWVREEFSTERHVDRLLRIYRAALDAPSLSR